MDEYTLNSDESILWLISKNDIVKQNLRLEAEKGVDPNRIIFGSDKHRRSFKKNSISKLIFRYISV